MLKAFIFAITGILLIVLYVTVIIILIKMRSSIKTVNLLKRQEVKKVYPELTEIERRKRIKLISAYINVDFQKVNRVFGIVLLLALIAIGISAVMWNLNMFCISVLVMFADVFIFRLWGYQKSKDGTVLKIQEDYLKNNPANELKMFIPSDNLLKAQLKVLRDKLILVVMIIVIVLLTMLFENIY